MRTFFKKLTSLLTFVVVFSFSFSLIIPPKEANATKVMFQDDTLVCFHPENSQGEVLPAYLRINATENIGQQKGKATIQLVNDNPNKEEWVIKEFKSTDNSSGQEIINRVEALKNFNGFVIINPDGNNRDNDGLTIGLRIHSDSSSPQGYKIVRDDVPFNMGNADINFVEPFGNWSESVEAYNKNNPGQSITLKSSTEGPTTDTKKLSYTGKITRNDIKDYPTKDINGKKLTCTKGGWSGVNAPTWVSSLTGAKLAYAYGTGMYFQGKNGSNIDYYYTVKFRIESHVSNLKPNDNADLKEGEVPEGYPCIFTKKGDKTPQVQCLTDIAGKSGHEQCLEFYKQELTNKLEDQTLIFTKEPKAEEKCKTGYACVGGPIPPAPQDGCKKIETAGTTPTTQSGGVNLTVDPTKIVPIVGKLENPLKFENTEDLLVSIINWFLALAGTVAVLFTIYGGFLYITSAGDPEKSKKATSTIRNAVIGLAVIILSYLIVATVVNILSGETPSTTSTTTAPTTSTTPVTGTTPSATTGSALPGAPFSSSATGLHTSDQCHTECIAKKSGSATYCDDNACKTLLGGSKCVSDNFCVSKEFYCKYTCTFETTGSGTTGKNNCTETAQKDCTTKTKTGCQWSNNQCVPK
jgi:hypothetical protein